MRAPEHSCIHDSFVFDSRRAGSYMRRRRRCKTCDRRFTTYELELPDVDGYYRIGRGTNGETVMAKASTRTMPVVFTDGDDL